ncbi:hypothetical protein J4557_47850 [Actinomadura nitritigenes]|uniref:Uncharacterized protein n=1 Tax=Actinomadura nitritigenes TaxID=134602 RepID=A0ABS3RG87_9ACTN|nr:hypothetical protein [Actinomadura nitritigenes]MBO2445244.1 hypothetical protein [Actinomadura nitritigenes]
MADTSGGGAAFTDPARVQTAAELGKALNVLRGSRTYAELDEAARALQRAGGGVARLPRSTVGDLVTKGRCERETLETFLAACEVPRDRHERWLAAWERTRTQTAPVPGAVRVRDASWRALGVHVPIEVPGADPDTLPAYVPRDIDEEPATGLRPWLRTAAGRGGMVMLVGGSSTGKTRCLLTAVQQVVPEWWLLHPRNATQLNQLANQPPGRLVIWLDELQSYLDGADGLTAATADALIQAGAVMVATLWPAYHDAYLAAPAPALHHTDDDADSADQADRYWFERQLLKLAHRIHLAERCSPAETNRARRLADTAKGGVGDPWLQAALRSCDSGLTQSIAAAPQLMNRWRNGTPYARAILTAAADAARLGVHSPPVEFLRAAAPGYCSPAEQAQAPTNWFEQALDYATQPLAGAAAALTPAGDGMTMGTITGYRLADYLDQHSRTERADQIPPHSFWTAAAAHAHPTDLATFGEAAWDRGLYRHAAQLWKKATKHGDPDAAIRLVTHLYTLHPADLPPARYAAAHVALDDPQGVAALLGELRGVGANEQVAVLAARAAAHVALDDPHAVAALLGELRRVGAGEQAAVLARRAAAHVALDDPHAVAALLGELRRVGAGEQAAVLARRAAAHVALDDPQGVAALLGELRGGGANEQVAVLAARAAAHVALDDPQAVVFLLGELRAAETGEQVAVLARRAAAHVALDDPQGVAALLGELRGAETGEQVAVLAARAAAHAALDDPQAVVFLLGELRAAETGEQAAVLAARAAAHVALDDPQAVVFLLGELRAAETGEQVAVLARRAAAHAALDDPKAVAALLAELRRVGANEQVAVLARRAAAHVALDDPQAVVFLLGELRAAETGEQVAVLARRAAAHAALNNPHAVVALLEELRKMGAGEQVTVLARRAVAHVALDTPHAVALLLSRLQRVGAGEQVAALLARDLAANVPLDNPNAVAALLGKLQRLGAGEQVTVLARRAAAHVALDDPYAVASLLDGLRGMGAGEQAAVLAGRAAANIALDNPQAVAAFLGRLRGVGAGEQVTVLARHAAAHAALDNPHAVATLLEELRWVGADEQVAVLAERAAAHVALDDPYAVAALLDGLREIGAAGQLAVLAERLPAAGLFAAFVDIGDRREQFRFGRDRDGSAAGRWFWEELQ